MKILVINCGSSSLKFQLLDMDGEVVLCKGLCDRIGQESSTITYSAHGKKAKTPAIFPTHLDAFNDIVKKITTGETKVIDSIDEVSAIGHRVGHGGEAFRHTCYSSPEMMAKLRELCVLAPLHNPAAIQGLESAKQIFGENTPNIAVFDTAFHSHMPPKAYIYAIPYKYYEEYGVRRYGFHGTSHKYVSQTIAAHLGKEMSDLRIISCHLGNGASIAAVDHGTVIDTSMGMTPLAGLMMGTRCGDLDPSVVNYLKYSLGITGHELDNILNRKSGLLGVSGVSSDKRDLEALYPSGHERAVLATDMFNYDIRKYVGSYMAAMGGVDIVLFTGGIGENDEHTRQEVCKDMEFFGIGVDYDKNWGVRKGGLDITDITADGMTVKTLVISTNEELMIARETAALVSK